MKYLSALLLLFSLTAMPTIAATAPNLLGPNGWFLSSPHPEDASQQVAPNIVGPAGGAVTRLTVSNVSNPLWLIQIVRDIPSDVPVGDLLKFHFWARSASSNPVRITIEQNVAPYQSIASAMATIKPDWEEYSITGLAIGQHENGLSAHIQIGEQVGTIDIADLTVTDMGQDPALANAQTELQPDRIQARIEKYRKGSLTLTVVDSHGHPISGAVVVVAQQRHAFLFGCNIFGLNTADSSPVQMAYQKEFASLFNYATVPFYWGAFESQQGKPDYDRLAIMADWCNAHGITVKGHPLVWHQVWPDWAPTDADSAIPLLKARVTDLITHYKGDIHYWDVLNEANGSAGWSSPNGESAWIRRDGTVSVVGTALDWARSAAKDAGVAGQDTFLYNDYDIDESNIDLLSGLQAAGKLPDAIGIQSHMHSGVWPLTKVWETCDNFSKFDRPIHFTETTVISGPKRAYSTDAVMNDWNTTPEDEQKQADYVSQFYTVLFSHPSVRAITWWDFSDLSSWMGAPSGLVRKDMSPKPVYVRLMGLIHKQWWTNTTGVTNRRGEYAVRVFYGDYAVKVTLKNGTKIERKVTFPEAAAPLTVVVQVK